MSTWEDLENDFLDGDKDEAEKVANLCFNANQEYEVSFCDMTYDEMVNAFDDLLVDLEMMLSKYASLKKQNGLLTNEINML